MRKNAHRTRLLGKNAEGTFRDRRCDDADRRPATSADDVENILVRLLQAADYDVELAQPG